MSLAPAQIWQFSSITRNSLYPFDLLSSEWWYWPTLWSQGGCHDSSIYFLTQPHIKARSQGIASGGAARGRGAAGKRARKESPFSEAFLANTPSVYSLELDHVVTLSCKGGRAGAHDSDKGVAFGWQPRCLIQVPFNWTLAHANYIVNFHVLSARLYHLE